ncbi:GNAT family N-acetyltransferase [Komagataeibacter oboediens]
MSLPTSPPGSPAGPWRPMQAHDLPAVMALATAMHPGCPERADVLDERRRLCPSGCLILPDAQGRPGGYVLSHPWRAACPPTLDTYLHRLPGQADCWYLHDIAITPSLRGHGAMHAALRILTRHALNHGMNQITLMAAEGARPVWTHMGFTPMHGIPPDITATYGADACPMHRAIPRTIQA